MTFENLAKNIKDNFLVITGRRLEITNEEAFDRIIMEHGERAILEVASAASVNMSRAGADMTADVFMIYLGFMRDKVRRIRPDDFNFDVIKQKMELWKDAL